jgi:hypothetical protein
VRIGCVPGVSVRLAEALARRPDTAWITLNSGGTQVMCVLRTEQDQDEDLLSRTLPNTARVTSVAAHLVLHAFFGNHQSLLNKTDALTAADGLCRRDDRCVEPVREHGVAEQRCVVPVSDHGCGRAARYPAPGDGTGDQDGEDDRPAAAVPGLGLSAGAASSGVRCCVPGA